MTRGGKGAGGVAEIFESLLRFSRAVQNEPGP
jgi:hypothetical protein